MTLILNGTDNSATTPAVTGTDTDTGVYYPAANQVALATNGTQAMLANANQGVQIANTLGVGATTPSTSGAGITFPATQSASSNANTLDDYEEGTWTPSLVGGVTAGTPTTGDGFYTKVGNLVTVFYRFESVVRPTGGASGSVTLSGLPFTANSSSVVFSYGGIGIIFTNGGTSLANMMWSHRIEDATFSRFTFQYTPNANSNLTNLDVSNMAVSGNYFRGHITYQV